MQDRKERCWKEYALQYVICLYILIYDKVDTVSWILYSYYIKGRDNLEDLGVGKKIIIGWVLGK
jgi:hypothetical protein